MSKAAFTTGLFLAALTGSAYAATVTSPDTTESGPKSAIVRYHEGELATSEGAERLYLSLSRAARDVCDDTREYELRASFAACEQNAMGKAISQLGDAKLTHLYNEHFPNAPLSAALSLPLQPTIVVVRG